VVIGDKSFVFFVVSALVSSFSFSPDGRHKDFRHSTILSTSPTISCPLNRENTNNLRYWKLSEIIMWSTILCCFLPWCNSAKPILNFICDDRTKSWIFHWQVLYRQNRQFLEVPNTFHANWNKSNWKVSAEGRKSFFRARGDTEKSLNVWTVHSLIIKKTNSFL